MKTALITGANGGIGVALAKKFLSMDYFVVGGYNSNSENIKKLESEFNGRFFGVRADFKSEKNIKKLYSFVEKNFGHADVLISNAGIDLYKLLTDTTLKEWEEVFSVNTNAGFLLCRECLPKMIERKSGKIVFISSIWGLVGGSMETAYSASKAAIIGLTKALAKEVAPSGITVNCVCPGVINTPMNDCFSKEEKKDIINSTPIGRMGTAEEIAELCAFLCGDNAGFITGQTITADGGFTL